MTDVYFRNADDKQVVVNNLELLEVAAESFVYTVQTSYGPLYFETKPDPTIHELLVALRGTYESERHTA